MVFLFEYKINKKNALKNIFILISVLLGHFTFSQVYSFDFLTKYVLRSADLKHQKTREIVTYFNADDFSYYLKIGGEGKQLTAHLYDMNSHKVYQFTVLQSGTGNDVQFQFKYVDSS